MSPVRFRPPADDQRLRALLFALERSPSPVQATVPWHDLAPCVSAFVGSPVPPYHRFFALRSLRVRSTGRSVLGVDDGFIVPDGDKLHRLSHLTAELVRSIVMPQDQMQSVCWLGGNLFLALSHPTHGYLLRDDSVIAQFDLWPTATGDSGDSDDNIFKVSYDRSTRCLVLCHYGDRVTLLEPLEGLPAGPMGKDAPLSPGTISVGAARWTVHPPDSDVRGAAILPGGKRVVVVDLRNSALILLDAANGEEVSRITSCGEGAFCKPQDVTVDPWGNVIVAGGQRNAVHVLDSDLNPIAFISVGVCAVAAAVCGKGTLLVDSFSCGVLLGPMEFGTEAPEKEKVEE